MISVTAPIFDNEACLRTNSLLQIGLSVDLFEHNCIRLKTSWLLDC